MAVTNTPDKSEMKACPSIDVRASILTTIKANREAGESQEVLARDLTTLFHKLFHLSRPPADQVPDMVAIQKIAQVLWEKVGPAIIAARAADIARDILAALKVVPAASEVDRLPENYELSHGPLNGDMSDCAWQVHSVNGGYNDREWTLVATGETPSEAIRTALKASGEE